MKSHDDLGLPIFDDKKPNELSSDYCKVKKVYLEKVMSRLGSGAEGDVLPALECAEANQLFKKYLRVVAGSREEEGVDFDEDKWRKRVDSKLEISGSEAMVPVDVGVDDAGSTQIGEFPEMDTGRSFTLLRLRCIQPDETDYTWLSDVCFVFVFHWAEHVRELCTRRSENQEEEAEQECVSIQIRVLDLVGREAPPGFRREFDVPTGGEEMARDFVRDFVRDWRVKCGLTEGFEEHTLQCVEVDGFSRVLDLDAQNLDKFMGFLNLSRLGNLSVLLEVKDTSSIEVEPEVVAVDGGKWEGDWRMDMEGIKIFPPQKDVARRIMCRMEYALAEQSRGGLGSFTDLAFVILLPQFRSLRDQTIERVKEVFRGRSGVENVLMFGASGNASVEAFADRAEREPRTLFLVIDDESHWNVGIGGVHGQWVNHQRLCGSKNVLMLFCSATPYNNLTKQSRIPARCA
jgi:hypothetical protein